MVDDLGFGGAERQVVELANHLDRAAFDVHVCALSDHIPLSGTLIDGERKLHTIRRRNRLDFSVVPRLARLLRTLDADIVHGFLFRAEIASRMAGRLAGTAVVIGSERNANHAIRMSNRIAYRLTGVCVDAIIANSNAGAAWNAQVFRRSLSDYRVVHNGVDAERFRPREGREIRAKLGIPVSCPVVGVFANFKKQKNHALLFRAFRLVLDSFPEARLLLVGEQPTDSRGRLEGYRAQLDRLVDDLQIRPRCTFLGHQKEVEHLYSACDLTVLPSLHEGTPNVLLESMACEVPVIATSICDNAQIVKEGQVGYLVAVGDEGQMADRIKLLLGNTALRQDMGRQARHWVLEEFSGRRLAEKIATIYLELLSQKRK